LNGAIELELIGEIILLQFEKNHFLSPRKRKQKLKQLHIPPQYKK
jgi:hypothetical protein